MRIKSGGSEYSYPSPEKTSWSARTGVGGGTRSEIKRRGGVNRKRKGGRNGVLEIERDCTCPGKETEKIPSGRGKN